MCCYKDSISWEKIVIICLKNMLPFIEKWFLNMTKIYIGHHGTKRSASNLFRCN